MFAHVHTAALRGVESFLVEVEVNLSSGLPAFTVVGLPHGAVRESRDRVAAALRNSGFPLPHRRITVNLAPGDVRKEGTAFDLPIAVGLLAAGGHLDDALLPECTFLGELGLDGSLLPIRGALPIAAECAVAGIRTLVVPSANAEEASVVPGVTVLSAVTLCDVITHFRGGRSLDEGALEPRGLLRESVSDGLDMRDVRGQAVAKRVLEIAAAGSHNVLLTWAAGVGQDDAGAQACRDPAPAHPGRGARVYPCSLGRGHAEEWDAPGLPAPFPGPSSHGQRRGTRRWWISDPAWGGQPGA